MDEAVSFLKMIDFSLYFQDCLPEARSLNLFSDT